MVDDLVGWGILIFSLMFIWYCPILKPWFGFFKPKYTKGKWFE